MSAKFANTQLQSDHPGRSVCERNLTVSSTDAEDAKRYRFLRSLKSRDNNHYTRSALIVAVEDWGFNLGAVGCNAHVWSQSTITENEMDEAIDAAMCKQS